MPSGTPQGEYITYPQGTGQHAPVGDGEVFYNKKQLNSLHRTREFFTHECGQQILLFTFHIL